MKRFTIASAGLLAFCTVLPAAADDHVTSISKSALASMGFGNVQIMSDSDGLSVRGKGWQGSGGSFTTATAVAGTSTANFLSRHDGNNATATNSYDAASAHSNGSSAASGRSLSFAGITHIEASGGSGDTGFTVGGLNVTSFSINARLVVSGGSAFASAH